VPSKLKLLIFFFLPALYGQAQVSTFKTQHSENAYREIGNLYFRNYFSKEYKGSFQNWGGLQDQYGVMYFSNGDGVISYDGKSWSLAETPTKSVIRSVAIDAHGKIFVAGLDELGELERKGNGQYIFKSLLDKINPELYGMGNIWQTFVHNSLVYFEAETGMFTWNGERFS